MELPKLNQKQKRFVKFYMNGMDPTEAYAKAGYNPANAAFNGARLIKNDKIVSHLKRHIQLSDKEVRINRNYVLSKYTEVIEKPDSQQVLLTALRDVSNLQGYGKTEPGQNNVQVNVAIMSSLHEKLKLLKGDSKHE